MDLQSFIWLAKYVYRPTCTCLMRICSCTPTFMWYSISWYQRLTWDLTTNLYLHLTYNTYRERVHLRKFGTFMSTNQSNSRHTTNNFFVPSNIVIFVKYWEANSYNFCLLSILLNTESLWRRFQSIKYRFKRAFSFYPNIAEELLFQRIKIPIWICPWRGHNDCYFLINCSGF